MSDLIFFGASDDLLEVSGLIEDEFDAYTQTTVVVTDPNGVSIAITAEFDPLGHPLPPAKEDSAWLLSVHHRNPAWTHPIRLGAALDGSAAIILDVPEGTKVRLWSDDDE